MSDRKQSEGSAPETGQRQLVAALGIVALAAVVAVPLLLRGNGGSVAATTTTVPMPVVELGPDGSKASARLFLTMPEGWTRHGWWASNDLDRPNWMAIAFGSVGNIYSDRCQWQDALLDPPLGPTVDDLAIAADENWGPAITSGPADVIFDGFAGKKIVVTVPTDLVFANCDNRQFRAMLNDAGGARYYQGVGQIDEWWILDIDGDRFLVNATKQVIESIQIEP